MWQPYIDIILAHLPDACLVFDRFHITQQILKAVDSVRREEAHGLRKADPELLRRSRYRWLKNPENLTEKQRSRLGSLEGLNLRYNRAYLFKDSLREF